MNHRNSTVLALALLGLAASAGQTVAQSSYTPYTFTTLAGNVGYGFVDGTGSAARFYAPSGVAVDSAGNVYVADGSNHTIRKVTPAGAVTTLAGLAGTGGSVDGTGATRGFGVLQAWRWTAQAMFMWRTRSISMARSGKDFRATR